jgi:hypothetical protein
MLGPRKLLDPKDALIICADPRGGSTWLFEMLTSLDGVAGLWEPLDISRAAVFRNLGFSHRQYFPEMASVPEARATFDGLFRGKHREPHIVQRTSVRELRNAELLLVKFCRATQLLPWMTREFSFTRKPVHLLRHPCAVVASKIKFGEWNNVKPRFDELDVLSDPVKMPYADTLLKIDSVEGRLAANWALTNSVALKHPERKNRWITILYEDLLAAPELVLSKVLQDWGLKIDNLEKIVSKPSKTTLKFSPIISGDKQKQLAYWQQTLSSNQIDTILSIAYQMGIQIYGPSAEVSSSSEFV